MLPEVRLDTDRFQELIEEARTMLAGIYPEWTDYNYHDPGMTFLELFAWLKENQQFHMEQLGEEHYRQFFKLLGFERRKRSPAEVLAQPERPISCQIPAGSRFAAGELIFETKTEENLLERGLCRVAASGVTPGSGQMAGRRTAAGNAAFGDAKGAASDGKAIYSGEPGCGQTAGRGTAAGNAEAGEAVLARLGELRFYPFGRRPQAGNSCTFYFGSPPEPGRIYHLFVQLEKREGGGRNPAKDGLPLPLARLSWSYYTAAGWRELEILEDETQNFLFDGRIAFRLSEAAASLERRFGASPGGEGAELDAKSGTEPGVELDAKFGAEPGVELGAESGVEAKRKPEYAVRVILSDCHYDIPPCFSGLSVNQMALVQKETWNQEKEPFWLAEGTGFPGQEYALPGRRVMAASVKLEAEDPLHPGEMVFWRQAEDFSGCGAEDRVFVVDEDQDCVRFGDGYRGLPPEGAIRLLSMAQTKGAAGNVKPGTRLFQVGTGEAFSVSTEVLRGYDRENLEEALTRLRTGEEEPCRAVTAADYERLVKRTPGLILYSCKVLTRECRDNQVVIVVRPGDGREAIPLSDEYRRTILQYLDGKRLIGTRIHLRAPDYIGVRLYLEVSAMPQYPRAREMVLEAVEAWFSRIGAFFGKTVSYGELYGVIDSLACVRRLRVMNLEAANSSVRRSPGGDLIPPPGGVFLLKQVDYTAIHE